MSHIPYGRQSISEEDIAAVVEVLRSDWLTQGPTVERFEQAVAKRCGVPHASAICNATAALHVAYRALDLGPGDLLWTSPITFVATTNAALYCGAEVDFVDIDPGSYNLSPKALAAKLERAAAGGRLPKLVVPVHLAGQSCDMRAIAALAEQSVIGAGMLPKLEACKEALRRGVSQVGIFPALEASALSAFCSGKSQLGTEVLAT